MPVVEPDPRSGWSGGWGTRRGPAGGPEPAWPVSPGGSLGGSFGADDTVGISRLSGGTLLRRGTHQGKVDVSGPAAARSVS